MYRDPDAIHNATATIAVRPPMIAARKPLSPRAAVERRAADRADLL
jgi:hypothetical protein